MNPPIKASFLTLDDCLHNNAAVSQGLLKHVMPGVFAAQRYPSVSIVSDKASVCGLSLDAGGLWAGLDGLCVAHDGHAALLPSQDMPRSVLELGTCRL